jgi:hypothetical protein
MSAAMRGAASPCAACSLSSRSSAPDQTFEPERFKARKRPGVHRSACAAGGQGHGTARPEPERLTREVLSIRHAPVQHHPNAKTTSIARSTGPRRAADQRFRWSAYIWSPPPESNRRPHPYHGTTGNRCADRRFPRSRPTVRAKVMGSPSVKLCAHPHATCGRLRPVPRAVLRRRRPRVKPSLAGWAWLPVMAMTVASVRAMIAAAGAIPGDS